MKQMFFLCWSSTASKIRHLWIPRHMNLGADEEENTAAYNELFIELERKLLEIFWEVLRTEYKKLHIKK